MGLPPERSERADTPNSGVTDLEPLQRLQPLGSIAPAACHEGEPKPSDSRACVTDGESLSPPEDAEPPQSGIVFWTGGVLSNREPLDRSAVIVRVMRPA